MSMSGYEIMNVIEAMRDRGVDRSKAEAFIDARLREARNKALEEAERGANYHRRDRPNDIAGRIAALHPLP